MKKWLINYSLGFSLKPIGQVKRDSILYILNGHFKSNMKDLIARTKWPLSKWTYRAPSDPSESVGEKIQAGPLGLPSRYRPWLMNYHHLFITISHYKYSNPHQSDQKSSIKPEKMRVLAFPLTTTWLWKKFSSWLNFSWKEHYRVFENNLNLKTTFPWRTPWRTSPSISPPFFRPIRTLNINSPRIHSHNSLQLKNCQVFPVGFLTLSYTHLAFR